MESIQSTGEWPTITEDDVTDMESRIYERIRPHARPGGFEPGLLVVQFRNMTDIAPVCYVPADVFDQAFQGEPEWASAAWTLLNANQMADDIADTYNRGGLWALRAWIMDDVSPDPDVAYARTPPAGRFPTPMDRHSGITHPVKEIMMNHVSADFMLRLEAAAQYPEEEPDLNTVITEARADYARMTSSSAGAQMDAIWRDAAAYNWLTLTSDPFNATEWASDSRRLAIVSTMLEHHREPMDMMILGTTLLPDEKSLQWMRRTLADDDVDAAKFDRMLSMALDDEYAYAPGDHLLARDVRIAMNVLDPLEQNAPTDVAWHIYAIKSAFLLAQGDHAGAMDLALQAKGYDPSDMLAAAVTARLSGGDPAGMAGTMTFGPSGPVL